MQVILLERVAKLGQMGETVRVRDGYARNFLLPQGKALRATESNKKVFEGQRAQLEARNLELKTEADAVGAKLDGATVIMIRQAGETGHLYGSVSPRDISDGLTAQGFTIARAQVALEHPIKTIGVHKIPVQLHPEVSVMVSVNVARSVDEANRQQGGEDLTQRPDEVTFETYQPEDGDDDDRG